MGEYLLSIIDGKIYAVKEDTAEVWSIYEDVANASVSRVREHLMYLTETYGRDIYHQPFRYLAIYLRELAKRGIIPEYINDVDDVKKIIEQLVKIGQIDLVGVYYDNGEDFYYGPVNIVEKNVGVYALYKNPSGFDLGFLLMCYWPVSALITHAKDLPIKGVLDRLMDKCKYDPNIHIEVFGNFRSCR